MKHKKALVISFTLAASLMSGSAMASYAGDNLEAGAGLLTTIIAASMGIGSLILAPAIVFGYAVKAAARDDRQRAAAKVVKAEKAARRVD